MKKTTAERYMNRCRYFTGIQNATCAAGVDYATVKDMESHPYRWACFADEGAMVMCAKRSFPSREEAEAEEREVAKRIEQVNVSRRAIVAHTNGARGVQGKIDCPVCQSGTLRFSVSGYNGHIHAACSTNDCVRWME